MVVGKIIQQVHIMMGLPGSGKTTWAKEFAANRGSLIISRDDIRYILKHNYEYDNTSKHQDLVWDISQYMIQEALKKRYNIILDQLSLTSQQRIDTVRTLRNYTNKKLEIILVYCIEEELNVSRRMNSNMTWGDRQYYINLIKKLKEEIEKPDYIAEGFDGLILVPGYTEINI